MNIYITFGQSHAHRVNNNTFDKDCIAEIKCKDYSDGRKIAHELFKGAFATSYTEEQIKLCIHFFPKGILKAN
jgi:hypothetical protein